MTKKAKITDPKFFVLNDRYCLLSDLLPGFPDGRRIELDLGCGKGDFSIALASRHPDSTVFAADIQMGRLRSVHSKSGRGKLENLYFFRVEARHFLTIILPDASIDRIHILCPDPWPKSKHAGHRLLSSDLMAQIARILKPGGVFHFSTDDEPYWTMACGNVEKSGLFTQTSLDSIADVSDIKTEFERQWIAQGKTVRHIVWTKN